MRFRPHLDSTQKEIVEGLRASGYSVLSLAGLGKGVPDILVGMPQGNVLLEVKSPKAIRKKKDTLDESQRKFFESWRGPVFVVESLDGALIELRAWEARKP